MFILDHETLENSNIYFRSFHAYHCLDVYKAIVLVSKIKIVLVQFSHSKNWERKKKRCTKRYIGSIFLICNKILKPTTAQEEKKIINKDIEITEMINEKN